MRKVLAVLSILLLSLFFIHADVTNAVYFTDHNNSSTRVSQINLNMDFFPAIYSIGWGKYDFNNGAYQADNWLGEFTVYGSDHTIELTVSTGNGRFVSASDPTKYREFSIAVKPMYRSSDNKSDVPYIEDITSSSLTSTVSGSDRVPTTKGSNTLTVYAPAFTSKSTIAVNGANTAGVLYLFYEILLCMDVAAVDDYMTLAELDDYYATITLTWRCTDSSCTNANHSGSATIILKGFYDSNNPKTLTNNIEKSSFVFMQVFPSAESTRMDIMDMINNSTKTKIASLDLNSTYVDLSYDSTNNKYTSSQLNNVRVFLSSNSNYNAAGSQFSLVNTTNGKTLDFNVGVYDSGTAVKTFDGTACWTNASNSASLCLDLSNYINVSMERKVPKASGQLSFNGDVMLDIVDDNETSIRTDASVQSTYSGEYMANIFYHIVYAQ